MSLLESIEQNVYNITGSVEVILGTGINGTIADTLVNKSPSVPILYYIGFVFGSLFIADGATAIATKRSIAEHISDKLTPFYRKYIRRSA